MSLYRFHFKDKDHGHIMADDLRVYGNNKLRNFFPVGPKYRMSTEINFKETRSELHSSLKSCIDSWCSTHGIHKSNFSEWKQNILTLAEGNILELSRQSRYSTFSILKCSPNNNLEDIKAKFVITLVDKATSNVSFICQRLCGQISDKKLGLKNNNISNNYCRVFKPIT